MFISSIAFVSCVDLLEIIYCIRIFEQNVDISKAMYVHLSRDTIETILAIKRTSNTFTNIFSNIFKNLSEVKVAKLISKASELCIRYLFMSKDCYRMDFYIYHI